jgi:hypothetical protein
VDARRVGFLFLDAKRFVSLGRGNVDDFPNLFWQPCLRATLHALAFHSRRLSELVLATLPALAADSVAADSRALG